MKRARSRASTRPHGSTLTCSAPISCPTSSSRRQLFDVRIRAARLPDPAGARARQAAGLARQRRHHAEAAGRDRPPARTSTSTRTRTSTAPRTRWRRARPTPTRRRARRSRRFLNAPSARRDRLRARRHRGASTWSRRAGAAATSARATRSSSPGSSTTPTSCPGSCCAPRRARGCASRRSTTAGRCMLEEYEKLLGPRTRLVVVHAGLERARHRHAGARDDRDGAPPRRARAGRRRAGGLAHARSTCRRSTATSTCSPATRCSRPTGIGVLFGKADVLDAMPPWQGGGNMIEDVTFEKTPYQPAPRALRGRHRQHRRRGRASARRIDYVERARHRQHRPLRARAARLRDRASCARVPGPARSSARAPEKAGVLSFVLDGHAHRGRRRRARPGGHRGALRPPLRAADPAPLRAREHRARRRSRSTTRARTSTRWWPCCGSSPPGAPRRVWSRKKPPA